MQTATSAKTHISSKMADELAHFLADTYTLYLKTQNFHWNVTGPHFYALHKMFEEQYQALAAAVDEIAERIRALGGIAPGSFTEFSKLTSLKDEVGTLSADLMLKKLTEDHENLSKLAGRMIEKSQQADDEGTADLLIQRQKEHDKTAWMLRSTLR